MRVLVTGGRDFTRDGDVWAVLDAAHEKEPITLLIHGAAPGADSAAESWAKREEVPYLGVPAQWTKYGRAAGPIRNRAMLNLWGIIPDRVIAFPGGAGTSDMKTAAANAGLYVEEAKP